MPVSTGVMEAGRSLRVQGQLELTCLKNKKKKSVVKVVREEGFLTMESALQPQGKGIDNLATT